MSYVKQENSDYHMDPKVISSSNIDDGSHGEYMHQSTQNSITAFLAKLWALVNDSTCDDLIAWDPSGGSFHVYDQARFSREILPRYFKHNNFASFIRQLNMYGFRKISTIEHGSLKNERDDIEFAHPNFIRGQEPLLELIKRRAPENQQKPNTSAGFNSSSALVSANYLDPKTGRSGELKNLLDDVRNLQTKQTSLNDKLSYMQSENQALWGEIGSLRQKHAKQQQIVSKLMEFLLHFISTNSHHHEHSVEQQAPNEVLTTDAFHHPEKTQTQHHTNNSPLILSDQGLSPNTLKRKHAAITHADEPNKRSMMQQQQQQQPPNLGRQQSVTINELTDTDTGGWPPHIANTSPVVDLVPSPPLPTLNADDYQQTDFRWAIPTNDGCNPNGQDQRNLPPQNQTFQTIGNGNNVANTYIPDFFLQTDNSTGIKTSNQVPNQGLLKQEQNEFANKSQQPMDNLKLSPTLYSQAQQQHKISEPTEQLSFSLDDITGDVDHIQSSLDNIRELMFDHLPDGTPFDDLFDAADHELLSPLLHPTSNNNNNQTNNLLLHNLQEQQPLTGDNKTEHIATTPTSQSVPNVNNQLLEQLITETAIVEEQRNTINQLAREKSDLEDKIHILEQQHQKQQHTTKKK